MAPSTWGTATSAASHRSGCSAPSRSARNRTCCGDSSPETYSTLRPAAATSAAAWSRIVDLPMPGSPPSRVTEPGTRPPPSTRSSSAMPVGRGENSVGSTSLMGTGATAGARIGGATGGPSASSTSVPQASQPGHWPTHLGAPAPHSVQRKTVRSRAMAPP